MVEDAHAKCAAHQHGAVPELRGPQLPTSMALLEGSMALLLGSMARREGSVSE